MGDTGTTASTTPGWFRDPTARYELRYHNGRNWTADVSTNGDRYVDPLGSRPTPHTPAAPTSPDPGSTPPSSRSSGATASMVLGIVAICIGWMPFVVFFAIIAGALAIGLGITARRRADPGDGDGFAVAGIVTGAIGLLVCIGGVIFSVVLIRAVDRFENPADHETAITSCVLDDGDVTATGTITNLSDSTATFTVRVYFVRPGTDNAQREATVEVLDVGPGDTAGFEAARQIGDLELDCIVGAVRGELPYGVDPGT